MPVPAHIATAFPRIVQADCHQSSQVDRHYNCIGFAADPARLRIWWPIGRVFWPRGVPREVTLSAFEAAFASLGYSVCATEALEAGAEKIAIFVDASGAPTHAARQREDGVWTSKLGPQEDIRHPLRQLEGTEYGTVRLIMSRRSVAPAPAPATPLS